MAAFAQSLACNLIEVICFYSHAIVTINIKFLSLFYSYDFLTVIYSRVILNII